MLCAAQAIDAAKKRAVAQGVDYDTFKNMVSVAHLRPLQAPSLLPQGECVEQPGLGHGPAAASHLTPPAR